MKRCTKCGVEKPLEDFHLVRKSGSQRFSRCKPCRLEDQREWYARLSEDERKARQRSPERNRDLHLRRTYGITLVEFKAMLRKQKGRCAICRTKDPGGRSKHKHGWFVDHCHKTGRVRGLLCDSCNRHLLAGARDDVQILRAAIVYLER